MSREYKDSVQYSRFLEDVMVTVDDFIILTLNKKHHVCPQIWSMMPDNDVY